MKGWLAIRAVIQRVKRASVIISGEAYSEIGPGLLVLLGVERGDEDSDARYIARKVSELRIFTDENGKMNLSALDLGLSVMVVSQFTLSGDVRKGTRPSFTEAARPETAIPLYEAVCEHLRSLGLNVQTGVFQAKMDIELVNDGPVTILLDSGKLF